MKEQSYVVAIIEHSGDLNEPLDLDRVLVVLRDSIATAFVAQRALELREEKERRAASPLKPLTKRNQE